MVYDHDIIYELHDWGAHVNMCYERVALVVICYNKI